MADQNTHLYATKGNGGRPSIRIGDIAASLSAATTTAPGVVKKSATVAALSSVGPGTPAAGLVTVTATPTQATIEANFATLGTSVNAILAALKAAGLMA